MTINEALQGVTRLFLDTAPVIYFVEKNPHYLERVQPVFAQIDTGKLTAVTSPVTLAERLVAPVRLGLASLQQDFADLMLSGVNTLFVSIGEEAAGYAADLRVRYNLTLPDAFQAAVALTAGCDGLLTNDSTLNRITDLRVIVLEDLTI
jgi:predicted nucleic acid-binding protein